MRSLGAFWFRYSVGATLSWHPVFKVVKFSIVSVMVCWIPDIVYRNVTLETMNLFLAYST